MTTGIRWLSSIVMVRISMSSIVERGEISIRGISMNHIMLILLMMLMI